MGLKKDLFTNDCKKSDIKIIAEYIHSEDVLKRIQEMGVDYSQGYYIGEPVRDIKVLD